MIDWDVAEAGLAALAVAIASILEDAHDLAVTKPTSLADYDRTASDLGVAGADVATLAAAMKIFIRRAASREQPLD